MCRDLHVSPQIISQSKCQIIERSVDIFKKILLFLLSSADVPIEYNRTNPFNIVTMTIIDINYEYAHHRHIEFQFF